MELQDFTKFDFLDNSLNPDNIDELAEVDLTVLSKKIKQSIERILVTRFPGDPVRSVLNPLKQKPNQFTFSCPHCGDSKRNARNQRGHVHLGNMAYKCWNGGCNVTFQSLYNFLKHFNRLDDFTLGEQAYIRSHFTREKKGGNSGVKNEEGSYNKNPIYKVHNIIDIDKYAIPRKDIMDKMGLVEVMASTEALRMLEKRKQITKDMRHFAYNIYNKNLYILNLSHDKQGVIGIQIRFSNSKYNRRFHSYQYSDIWEKIFKVGTVKDEIKQKMDRLSMIYNILHIDYTKPINIFEGSIDSHHLPNSIATWSASVKLYLPTGRYFYDNSLIDDAGLAAATFMLNKGHYVFLWKKFLDDYPEYYNCSDLNDIFKLKPIGMHVFEKYYSNESLDILYL